jgi:tetratricopeptide (TPR) repeat protein
MSASSPKPEDTDFEIQFYEALLKEKPDFLEALIALGDLYTQKGLHEKGLEIDQRLLQLRPEDPIILYNLACSYSLLNDIEKALSVIKLAIRCGYDDLNHLEQDNDLTNLRSDQRFRDFITGIRNK